MITTAISKLTEGISLTFEEVTVATQEIMTGQATAAQIAGYLTALRIKGESANEIAGMATVMRQHAQKVDYQGDLLDLVGTGGDSVGPFNISTASCFVMAASGIKIAKHGNRAASSLSALFIPPNLVYLYLLDDCEAPSPMNFLGAPQD